jgi:hypothetical protein
VREAMILSTVTDRDEQHKVSINSQTYYVLLAKGGQFQLPRAPEMSAISDKLQLFNRLQVLGKLTDTSSESMLEAPLRSIWATFRKKG